jgi:hypothetical protein
LRLCKLHLAKEIETNKASSRVFISERPIEIFSLEYTTRTEDSAKIKTTINKTILKFLLNLAFSENAQYSSENSEMCSGKSFITFARGTSTGKVARSKTIEIPRTWAAKDFCAILCSS